MATNSILLKRGSLSALRGRCLSIQLRTPARIRPEATFAGPSPRGDPKPGEIRASEAEDAALALLFHEYKQACVNVVIAEGRRRSIHTARPECDESAGLGRRITRSPNMPCLVSDLDNSRLIVTVLRFRRHRNGHPHLGRISLERTELHPARLSNQRAPHLWVETRPANR